MDNTSATKPHSSLKQNSPVSFWFLKNVNWQAEERELFLRLVKSFELVKLKLGEDLTLKESPNPVSDDYAYLVCRGKVRLLAFSGEKQREASIQLLSEGSIIGADKLLDPAAVSYKAIATTPTVVAKISLSKLQVFFTQLPAFQNYWRKEVSARQSLLFLKCSTVFSQIPGEQLQKVIPYLKEVRIPAGQAVCDLAAPEDGHFWLRQGKIVGQPEGLIFSWGYPNQHAPNWFAQTDLFLYQFPTDSWKMVVEVASDLAHVLKRNNQNNLPKNHSTNYSLNQSLQPQQLAQNIPAFSSSNTTSSTTLPSSGDSTNLEVNFPQPKKVKRSRLWPRYPFIPQQSSSDCGATCLAMVSKYWGKNFSINSLRDLASTSRQGASLKSLTDSAEALGYLARPVRASLNSLAPKDSPWIAHWEGNHYVVVYKVTKDKVIIADPAQGKVKLSRQQFTASWTGYALLLDPTEKLYGNPDDELSLSRFLYLLIPYRSLGIQIVVTSVLIQIFGLVTPLFTQIILDRVVVSGSQDSLNVFVTGALIFSVWGIGLTATRTYLLSYLANRLDLTMIGGFINHALSLPLRFFESRRVGDIITRVQENQKIQRFLVGKVLLSWLDLLGGFVYLALMFYYNWRLTILIVALIPPIAVLTLVATPLLRRISRERFKATAEQNSSLVEMITGIATVKTAATEKEFRWQWEELLTKQINVRFQGQKLAINLELLSGLINTIGGMALLWYGAFLVINGQLTIGQYVAFNMMKGNVIAPMITLVGLWDELQEVLISVERLNDVFEAEPEERPKSSFNVLPSVRGDIIFNDVTFRYETEAERNILQNISFRVKPGQTVAIVGRSGSGKSTLVKLLQGLYKPTNGKILIDGQDITKTTPSSLRPQLGVVPQECELFSGTILDNITLNRPGFTLEQVVEVAKLAEAHSFIQAFPLGYNTKVGERGTRLSGGQKQRIAIARALLGEPKILLLDEATSSLDTESEHRFQQNLARLSQNQTTLIIAHRLSTVRSADSILVLEQGVLAEQGNHRELIAKKGIYYYLAQQQIDT